MPREALLSRFHEVAEKNVTSKEKGPHLKQGEWRYGRKKFILFINEILKNIVNGRILYSRKKTCSTPGRKSNHLGAAQKLDERPCCPKVLSCEPSLCCKKPDTAEIRC